MKLKEKFDSIDQSKLNADQKDFLSKIEKATKNFTSDNKEVNDKVEGALDKMIATFKEKMPEAIKTKAEKKQPKTSAKKEPKAKSSQTNNSKRTVMSVAKEIRKDGESWADAQKRARAEMKKDKESATKEVKTEMDKLLAFIKTRKELDGIGGTDLKRDSARQAKPRGRRISKDGNVYYENRENRIDRLAPNYPKDAPMLAKGGFTNGRYEVVKVIGFDKDGNNLPKNQLKVMGDFDTKREAIEFAYQLEMKRDVTQRDVFVRDTKLNKEIYAGGGDVDEYVAVTETKDDYWVIVSRPTSKKMAEEMAKIVTTKKDEKNKVVTLAQAKAHKKVLGKEYLDKFELGGNTNKYKVGQKFYDTRYDRVSEIVPSSNNALITFVRYNKSGTEMDMSTKQSLIKNQFDYLVNMGAYQFRNYELGGTVVTDLAGHTGGSFGGDPTLLSGVTGTQYSGLVGETGAMSAGEMFENGGGVEKNDDDDDDDDCDDKFRKGGALTNDRRHVNYSQDYEVRYSKNNPNKKRHGYGGMKFEDGGDFQAGVYAKGGGLGVHGLKEGDQIIKTLSGGIQKIKNIKGEIVYVNLANGERSSVAPLPFNDGGKVPEFIVNKDGIRVSKMVEPKKKLSEKEWMAKHNESKEARAYKYGGKLDNYSDFVKDEFPKAKREANKYSKKYKVPYIVVVQKNEDSIGVRTLYGFLDYPKSYQETYDVLYETKVDYEEGGNLETNIKSRLAKNFNLPLEVAVYVPSTKDADEAISEEEFEDRVESVQKYLSDLFGGFSSNDVDGGYMSQEKGLITEEVYKVISFAQRDGFSSKMEKLVVQIKKWAKDWEQESIGLEFEGDLFYIDQKGNYAEGGEINAFSMRMVKGTNSKPDEVLTENQEVKFAGGGKVEKRQAYLDTLADKESDIWDKLGAESGADIRQDKDMLRNYALKMEAMLKREGVGKGSFDEADYDHFQDMNAHLMNEFLVWNNYYEPEMTVREKKWRTEKFPDSKYRNYVADPKVISISETSSSDKKGYVKIVKTGSKQYKVEQVSNSGNYNMFNDTWSLDELEKAEKFAKKIAENNRVEYVGVDTAPYDFVHGKSKNYIVHADIKFVTVKKDGKELKFKGSNVLNGANILKNGGELSESATYYPKRSIVSVELKDGKKIKPSNGYWIKKNAKAEPSNEDSKDSMFRRGFFEENGLGVKYVKNGVFDKAKFKEDMSKRLNNNKRLEATLKIWARELGMNPSKYINGRIVEDIDFTNDSAERAEELFNNKFSGGGKVSFAEKSKAIAKNFEGKRVEPKYQKEYGKTYDAKEAKEVGDKIAGAQKAKYDAKAEKGAFLKNELYDKPVKVEKKDVVKFKGMLKEIGVSSPYMEDISDEQFNINQIEFYFKNKSDREKAFNKYHGMFDKAEKGAVVKKRVGNPNAGSAMILAKKIRKDGEKWTDALKRANAMIKNK